MEERKVLYMFQFFTVTEEYKIKEEKPRFLMHLGRTFIKYYPKCDDCVVAKARWLLRMVELDYKGSLPGRSADTSTF